MNFDALRDFLDYYLPMLGVPGQDTIVYKNHEVIFRHTSGYDNIRFRTPMRNDALYNLYSCTKVSIAVATAQLIERGEILLTDPVYAYIPEFADITVKEVLSDGGVNIRPAKTTMLIKHLITMTSGLDYNLKRPGILEVQKNTNGACPTVETVKAMVKDPLLADPGERYIYSLSHDVMGAVIELVSGMKLGEYLAANIYEPLGMKNTGFARTPDIISRLATHYDYDEVNHAPVEIPTNKVAYVLGTEYESGGAGLVSSVEDYALLADALAMNGVGASGERILSEASIRLMKSNMLNEAQLRQFDPGIGQLAGYGYGLGVRTNMYPERVGNLAPVGQFGWDGAKSCVCEADTETGVSFFHAEHINTPNKKMIIPRMRNLIYAAATNRD